MTIACLGITVLDRIFRVPLLPSKGGKYVASDYFEVGGGPAATAAVAIKKLGHPVEFIGRVGSDSVASVLSEEFLSNGVGIKHVKHLANAKSSFSAIMVDDSGERMIINYQDSTLSRDVSWLGSVDFSEFSALLCDVRWPEGALYSLEKAKEVGIPTVLDADITPDDISSLVKIADHVVFSHPGLKKFTGELDPLKGLRIAQESACGKVYVTVGSDGCFWLENDELKHLPSFKVDVVDTTGAGDVFHGAFTLAVAENSNSLDAVKFSSAVAALKCTRPGGREGIPDRVRVSQFLEEKY